MRDFITFTWSTIQKWSTLVTGGVVMGVIWLWSVISNAPFPRTPALLLAGAFVFWGTYRVWSEERRRNHVLSADVTELRKELERLTTPDFTAIIKFRGIGEGQVYDNQPPVTLAYFLVSVFNTGAPSIADNWVLTVIVDGRRYATDGVIMHETWSLADEHGRMTVYSRKDFLPEKTLIQPIPTGGQTTGIVAFAVRDIDREPLQRADIEKRVRFRLTFTDIQGQGHEARDQTYKRRQDAGHYSGVDEKLV
jgi:hypothetical protein